MRTEASGVELSTNGMYLIAFTTYTGTPGRETVAATYTSAPVFPTEDAAYYAQARALDLLEQTGSFPDLTKYF